MKYQDLCTKRTWEQNGEKKIKWLNVGTKGTTDDGKEYVELNILPNTVIYVFDQKAKDEQEINF